MRRAGQNLLIVIVGLAGGACLAWSPVVPVLVPLCLGAVALVIAVLRVTRADTPGYRRWLMVWTLGALAVHVLVGLAILATVGLGQEDALHYDLSIRAILNHWDFGSPLPTILPGKVTFLYAVAGLYRVVGATPAALIAVNAVLAAALVPLTVDTTKRLFGSDAVRSVPAVVTFLPGILVWSSLPLREALVLFLIAISANAAARVSERPRLLPSVVLIADVGALLTLRAHIAITVAAGLLVAMLASGRPRVAGAAMLVCASVALCVLAFRSSGMPGSTMFDQLALRDINEARVENSVTSTSGFSAGSGASTLAGAGLLTTLNFPQAFAGPFPWQLHTMRHLVVLPDCITWWLLLPMLWAGLRSARSGLSAGVLLLVLPALLTQMLLSLAVGDFGTLFRQRPQVAILLVPIIALGLSRRAATSSAAAARGSWALA